MILAEDIRAEVDGRFSIIGAIPYKITISKLEKTDSASTNLAAYAEIEGIKQASTVNVKITDPDNKTIVEGHMPPPPAEDAEANKGFIIAGKFQNIIISKEGIHRFIVSIDGKEYSKELLIKFSE
ncbi:hypothetical protein D3C78_417480 [compost metagenome]